MNNKKNSEWNTAYKNKDNFVFYPQEDIVRFVSKYIKKRIGLNKYLDWNDYSSSPKVLDFGCGIGRHVKLLNEFGLDAYGFDLSDEAIKVSKQNFKELGLMDVLDNLIVADITNLPYENDYFDFMLSHGVLDSMPFEIARSGLIELHRCLKRGGKVYFDLISSDDSSYDDNGFEKTVSGKHENGTIQSYFDEGRINKLIEGLFRINEIRLNLNKDIKSGLTNSRYHIVVEKI